MNSIKREYVIFYPSLESSRYQEKFSDGFSLLTDLKSIAEGLKDRVCCYYQPYLWVYGKKCYRFSVFEQDIEHIDFSEFLPILKRRISNGNISYDPRRDDGIIGE